MFIPDEVPKYRKKAVKKTPKKARHKHQYEPVVIKYLNIYKSFEKERGFIPGIDFCCGSKCSVCGRVEYGFPKAFEPNPRNWPRGDDVIVTYPGLPIVEVKDILHPNLD